MKFKVRLKCLLYTFKKPGEPQKVKVKRKLKAKLKVLSCSLERRENPNCS